VNDIPEFSVSADYGAPVPFESYTSYFNTFLNTAFIHFKGLTSYGVRLYLLLIIIYSKIEKLTMEFIISIFQSNDYLTMQTITLYGRCFLYPLVAVQI